MTADSPVPVWLTRQQIDQLMTDSRSDRELHDVLRAALDQEPPDVQPLGDEYLPSSRTQQHSFNYVESDEFIARRWLTEHGKHGLSYVDGEVVPGTSELFTPAIGQGRWTCWWVPDAK